MPKTLLPAILLALFIAPAAAAVSLTISVNEQPYAGTPITIRTKTPTTIAIAVGGAVITGQVFLPSVPGLVRHGSSGTPGKISTYAFYVTPTHAGDITIPAFDIVTAGGPPIHIRPIRLRARD